MRARWTEEALWGEVQAYFEEKELWEHWAALVRLAEEERGHMEAAIQAIGPNLSATAVDNAAHGALRRLWGLAPKIASECGSAGEFKSRLYKLLGPCVRLSALDGARRQQRRERILASRLFVEWEAEDGGSRSELLRPEEVKELLDAIMGKLRGRQSVTTTAVLRVMMDWVLRPGVTDIEGSDGVRVGAIRHALRKRGIHASDHEIRRARERIRAIAAQLMEEPGWRFEEAPRSADSGR